MILQLRHFVNLLGERDVGGECSGCVFPIVNPEIEASACTIVGFESVPMLV